MKRAVTCVVAVMAMAALAPGASAEDAEAPRPDFAGEWQRNAELSQDPQQKLASVADPMGGRSDQPERRYFYKMLGELFKQLDYMEIEQSEDSFHIAIGDEIVRIFYPGRKHKRQSNEGVKIDAFSRFLGSEFIIEEADEDGGKIIERLSLLGEGEQLSHLLTWSDKRLQEPLMIRTVFDRIEDAE